VIELNATCSLTATIHYTRVYEARLNRARERAREREGGERDREKEGGGGEGGPREGGRDDECLRETGRGKLGD
jgi:hypothetical protein